MQLPDIDAIISPDYKTRPFLNGTGSRRRSYSPLDKHSPTPDGRGKWLATDEPEMITEVTRSGFRTALWVEMLIRVGHTYDDIARIQAGVTEPRYVVHALNRNNIGQIIDIVMDTKQKKGAYICGNTGRGKTFIMDCITAVIDKYVSIGVSNVRPIHKVSHYDIYLAIEKSQSLAVIDKEISGHKDIYLDDYSYKGDPYVHIYGKQHNLNEIIIERCHYLYERGRRIWMTSNFSLDDISRSGCYPASMSRLRGMVSEKLWHGEHDFRL